ncbi:MAG: amidohydrolase, partial [Acidobacteriota bacterium]
MRRLSSVLLIVACLICAAAATTDDNNVVVIRAPRIALTHVKVIDGTGRPAVANRTIVIDGGRIVALGPAASTPVPPGAEALDLPGHTVIPGLVGMHNHLFYAVPP